MRRSGNGLVKREGDAALSEHLAIKMSAQDMAALTALALREERSAGAQARYIIRQWIVGQATNKQPIKE